MIVKFQFDDDPLFGDRSVIVLHERDGCAIRLQAAIEYDSDADPYGFDCYTEEEIRLWKQDDWSFCSVVLSLTLNGKEVADIGSCCGLDLVYTWSELARHRGIAEPPGTWLSEVASELVQLYWDEVRYSCLSILSGFDVAYQRLPKQIEVTA